jgi:hypothetical protein
MEVDPVAEGAQDLGDVPGNCGGHVSAADTPEVDAFAIARCA